MERKPLYSDASNTNKQEADWLVSRSSPAVLAVRGDVTCSTTFSAEGGVGDAARLSVLPGTQDPAETEHRFKDALHESIVLDKTVQHDGLITAEPSFTHLLSSSLRVPFSLANSLNCIFRRSFWSSGVSMPCFRMLRICKVVFLTIINMHTTSSPRGTCSTKIWRSLHRF